MTVVTAMCETSVISGNKLQAPTDVKEDGKLNDGDKPADE
jgi:hypothetical protein